MVCIFTFIYFFFYYFSRSKSEINPIGERYHFVRSISRIGIFSVIAIAISACILLPALYSLSLGKNNFSDPSFTPAQKFDFLDLLTMMFPGSYDTVRPEGLPLIYCGLVGLICLPLYFVSKHIKHREKIASAVFIGIFILSFNLSTADIFWHGMQKPNWLNYRYSFMLCFFVLLLGLKAFNRIKDINRNTVLGICGFAAILLFLFQKLEYDNVPDFACVWFSLIFLVIYAFGIPMVSKSFYKVTATMILCVIVCLELFINGLLSMVALDDDVVISSYNSYHTFIDNIRPIIDDVQESDDSFYRMEKTDHRKVNDPMALGLRGFSNSTSTLNEDTILFLNKMGLASKSHWTKYAGATPVFDSLFGVKYIVCEDTYELISPLYSKYAVDNENSYIAYYNPYALSIAYGVNENIKGLSIVDPNELLGKNDDPVDIPEGYVDVDTPFERYNMILGAMLGESEAIEIFKPITEVSRTTSSASETYMPSYDLLKFIPSGSGSDASVTFTLESPISGELYCYFPSDYPREVKLKLNGVGHDTYFGNETHRIVSLGTFEKGETIRLTMTLTKDDLYILSGANYFFYIDNEVFEDTMASLSASEYQIEEYTEDSFHGTISVTSDNNTVFTTIPYDKGWQVYVDGNKIETYEALDAVLAFDIEPGTHSLEMVYRSDAMVWGGIITLAGLTVFALILIFENKLRVLYFRIMPEDKPSLGNDSCDGAVPTDEEIIRHARTSSDKE